MNTVAAISTPHGRGGVSMIRITGDEAFSVAEKVFRARDKESFEKRVCGRTFYGSFCDSSGAFDDGIVILYASPHSYTGENVAELCCHGGLLVTRKLLTAVFSAGAYPAAAGEFTKRAFINGKLSLTQAEAVGGIIDAQSDRFLEISARQANGSLSRIIGVLSAELRLLVSSVYAYIDYPDEDLTDVSVAEMKTKLSDIKIRIDALTGSHAYGKAISEGIKTAIVGKPNTGKSSLLNMLCGEDRAIVTDVAGTTRDVITETVRLGDMMLHISDTAGIRDSGDGIEMLGIEKSKSAIFKAELVLFVLDGSTPPDDEDKRIIDEIKKSGREECTVFVLNKSDLGAADIDIPFGRSVSVCCARGEGTESLRAVIEEMNGFGSIASGGEIVANARQNTALEKASRAVGDAVASLDGFTQDIAGMDIEYALAALSEADGRSVSEDIVNEIFSHFCVGK